MILVRFCVITLVVDRKRNPSFRWFIPFVSYHVSINYMIETWHLLQFSITGIFWCAFDDIVHAIKFGGSKVDLCNDPFWWFCVFMNYLHIEFAKYELFMFLHYAMLHFVYLVIIWYFCLSLSIDVVKSLDLYVWKCGGSNILMCIWLFSSQIIVMIKVKHYLLVVWPAGGRTAKKLW